MLGANPFESNGSLATAPDLPGRIEAILARGGKVVVVDPRRTKTAEAADEHSPSGPAPTRYLLAAIVNVLVRRGLRRPRRGSPTRRRRRRGRALRRSRSRPRPSPPSRGVDADDDPRARPRARRRADAPRCTAASARTRRSSARSRQWLVDVLNILTGNLDRPGGAMFTKAGRGPANTRARRARAAAFAIGRRRSRVAALPEALRRAARRRAGRGDRHAGRRAGPGPGHRRRQPGAVDAERRAASTPRSPRSTSWCRSTSTCNETTRHADVILPPPAPLQKPHYDLALLQLAVRNVANWSEPVLPLDAGQPDEWEILAKLALIAAGHGRRRRPGQRSTTCCTRPCSTRAPTPDVVDGAIADDSTGSSGRRPERLVDVMLRTGPYDAHARRPAREPARHRPRRRSSRACPRCCARRRA